MPEQMITCPYCLSEMPLPEALIHQIKEELRQELAVEVEKKEQAPPEREEPVCGYLSSPAFRQKLEVAVEALVSMKEDLNQEEAAMAKMWAKREKQIERAIKSTARMIGELQGIIGAAMPEIKGLQWRALTLGEESDESA
ncbi:MAG: DUF2130 domain-containing protein [candidate division NC10 bacterium]|nr:DUF2130 domain-containing protein [candidate division NC10 bacterium]